jgi:large subunit ribosomal protein L9
MMKVILTENLAAMGQIGQVVNVAPGYARNYLFPQGLALEATGKNVKELDHRKRVLAAKREKVRQEMLSVAEKMNLVKLVLRRKVADEDKLYGSVSTTDLQSALEAQGFTVARKDIQLEQPIKQLGEFTITVRVDAQISATVGVVVEKEE